MNRSLRPAALGLLLLLTAALHGTPPSPRKVVVLGFDGADPKLVRKYMAEGAMPHFQRLAERGCFLDLEVTNTPNYRVSWQTSLGGAPERLIETNQKAWSGDHCSLDPCFVPGMILSNRPLGPNPHMIDVASTILDLLGLPPEKDLEGHSLLAKEGR
jgi:predicted AlkP superfamily phosphohydrolase/phosphomutase